MPGSAVRAAPSSGWPEIAGAVVTAGAAGAWYAAETGAVVAEVCDAEPPAFVAVTTTARPLPMSAEATV